MSHRLVVVLAIVLAGASCTPTETSAYRRTPGPAATAPAAGIQREPADLPVLPGESAVISAFAQASMPVRMIGASKFAGMLGSQRPARVFTAAATWGAGGADVLFLDDSIGDVRVCVTSGTARGSTVSTIFVHGRPVDRTEFSRVLYSMGPGFFVLAWDTNTSDALRQGLDLEAPRC